MLTLESSSHHSPNSVLPVKVQLALSSLLYKERSLWIAAPLASTALYTALQVLAKAPVELDDLSSLVESNRNSSHAARGDTADINFSTVATILARCHAHLVSMRTVANALRGEPESTNNGLSEVRKNAIDGTVCLNGGRMSRVLAQLLESRDGDPDGAWILHVSFIIHFQLCSANAS
jgi:hypothetical protein